MNRDRSVDMLCWERRLGQARSPRIAGVDEAGRGPLAGPVVAAAVRLPPQWLRDGAPEDWQGLTDSKRLSPKKRERYFERIAAGDSGFFWALGSANVEEIDRLNILQATFLAMRRALDALPEGWELALIDGSTPPDSTPQQIAVVGGDAASLSIAAASVLAKVSRDRELLALDREFPQYGFAKHKGYPTKDHIEALATHGPCEAHRRSFRPVREAHP